MSIFISDKIKVIQTYIKVLQKLLDKNPEDSKLLDKLKFEKQELEKLKDLYPSEFI